MVSRESAAPNLVNKYLLPHEHKIMAVRQHPAMLIQPITAAAGALLAAVGVVKGVHGESGAKAISLALALYLSARAFNFIMRWFAQYWVITNERLMITSGFYRSRVDSYDLEDFRYCALERPISGRLLGYGNIIFNSGRLNDTVSDFMPYPDQMYLVINGLMAREQIDQRS
jgi:hypothetical protein